MTKTFKIEVDIYPLVLVVMINESNEKCYKLLTKMNVDEADARLMDLQQDEVGKTNIFGRSLGVIRINRKVNTPEFHSTLAHELVHIVLPFLVSIGFKVSNDSEEAYAYLMGHLTEKIYRKL